ncbi:hypothetical protein C8034_v008323 [Colletotrichum sidae]|uniref:Uncharacterized protein n=1 Tax=Colletotrichum sidae TaxID=1347389 RepID=A0A4R8TQS0_9PEZI|nr:hypothetical protein C8034_v008323 [Colletotrichum sidae]
MESWDPILETGRQRDWELGTGSWDLGLGDSTRDQGPGEVVHTLRKKERERHPGQDEGGSRQNRVDATSHYPTSPRRSGGAEEKEEEQGCSAHGIVRCTLLRAQPGSLSGVYLWNQSAKLRKAITTRQIEPSSCTEYARSVLMSRNKVQQWNGFGETIAIATLRARAAVRLGPESEVKGHSAHGSFYAALIETRKLDGPRRSRVFRLPHRLDEPPGPRPQTENHQSQSRPSLRGSSNLPGF